MRLLPEWAPGTRARRGRRSVPVFVILTLIGAGTSPAQQVSSGQPEGVLFGELPVVTGASRFTQDADEAPASVTVITAAEIARQGWRTLADALASVRGFYTSYDRNYTYLGVRGFSQADDFNTRVLLLLDGQRMNENVGGSLYLATESPVEMELVDRIEVIRGPGSSLYGTGAFLAVINVVTIRGRLLHAGEVSGALQSFGGRQLRATLGNKFLSGLEVLASGTLYQSSGQDLAYPELASPGNAAGLVPDYDGDRREHAMLKVRQGGFTFLSNFSRRRKEIPTGSYGTMFNDRAERTTDQTLMMALQFAPTPGRHGELHAAISFNSYDYDAVYPYPGLFEVDSTRGRWWIGEATYSLALSRSHTLIVGGEYQLNSRAAQATTDATSGTVFFQDNTRTDNAGLFAQDQISLGTRFLLNAGLRYDHAATFGGTLNPRLGLIYHHAGTAVKLLAGRAFRAPTNYEQYYADGSSQKQSLTLRPEDIWSVEAGLDRRLSEHWRVSLSAYQNQIRRLISVVTDPLDSLLVFRNVGSVDARGIEVEVEGGVAGVSVRASYGFQHTHDHDSDGDAANSPRHLAKLNLSRALFSDHLTAGVEVLAISDRAGESGARVPGHVITNLTLHTEQWPRGVSLGLSAYNLFDVRYGDPAGPEFLQTAIAQDGQSLRATLELEF